MTSETEITVGQSVKRVQPGDYTNGRIGEVLELDMIKGRARVMWHTEASHEGNYRMTKPIRTWVSFKVIVPTDDPRTSG